MNFRCVTMNTDPPIRLCNIVMTHPSPLLQLIDLNSPFFVKIYSCFFLTFEVLKADVG